MIHLERRGAQGNHEELADFPRSIVSVAGHETQQTDISSEDRNRSQDRKDRDCLEERAGLGLRQAVASKHHESETEDGVDHNSDERGRATAGEMGQMRCSPSALLAIAMIFFNHAPCLYPLYRSTYCEVSEPISAYCLATNSIGAKSTRSLWRRQRLMACQRSWTTFRLPTPSRTSRLTVFR